MIPWDHGPLPKRLPAQVALTAARQGSRPPVLEYVGFLTQFRPESGRFRLDRPI